MALNEYTCPVPGCGLDMTSAVLRAQRLKATTVIRQVTMDPLPPTPVTLTCSRGHTCTYGEEGGGWGRDPTQP
jgi:hypothetical protein